MRASLWGRGCLTFLAGVVLVPVAWIYLGPLWGLGVLAAFVGALLGLLIRGSLGLERKVCPRCAERIPNAALICRYCGFKFPRTHG
jgi:hypothetical protein